MPGFFPEFIDTDLSPSKRKAQKIRVSQTATPTLTVVTIEEMRNYLKIDTDADDSLIDDIVMASQKVLQNQLGGFSIVTESWRQTQNGGVENIDLLRWPVLGTPTVTFFENFNDLTGSVLTSNSDFRRVEETLYHSSRFFREGREGDGYIIDFDTGMFTASAIGQVDPALKNAVMRMGAFLYENREEFAVSISEGNWSISYDMSKDPAGIKYVVANYGKGFSII